MIGPQALAPTGDGKRCRRRRRALPALGLVALALPMTLAGCGQVGDATRGAASSAASSAAQSARRAATDKVLDEVCRATTGSGPLADVHLSRSEREAVGALAALASSAGVPKQYVDPLRQVASSRDGQDVADAVRSLRTACANRPSGSAG